MTRALIPLLVLAACGRSPTPSPSPAPAPTPEVLAARAVQDTGPSAVAGDTGAAAHDDDVQAAFEPTLEPEPDPFATATPSTSYEVRHGETLAHFARWSELPVEAIAAASAHPLSTPLPVGAEVRVPGDEHVRARVEKARDAHHRRRAHGYLAGRGGADGTEFYTVRTGDTAWSVARNEAGIPVWLLESYNPSVDLDALRPGQQLMLPVLADTTADAAATPPTPDSSAAP